MPAILKTAASLLGGKLGSTEKATLIVRSLRTMYGGSATVILLTWYLAYRNERVAPHKSGFPFPGTSKLKAKFRPDRPNTDHDIGYQPNSGKTKATVGSPGSVTVSGSGSAGPPDWGGTKAVAESIVQGLGLSVSSSKRSTETTTTGGVSDHWIGCKECYALDNTGSVQAMDQAARTIISRLGGHYNGGELVFSTEKNGFRIQVLYRTYIGGNHFTHIHVGVRKVGYEP